MKIIKKLLLGLSKEVSQVLISEDVSKSLVLAASAEGPVKWI